MSLRCAPLVQLNRKGGYWSLWLRIKRSLQRLLHKRRNTRLLGTTATCRVEYLDVILADERCQSFAGTFVAAALAEVQPGLAVFLRKLRRALTSSGKRSSNREDDRAVGVADVPLCALQVGS